jgi:hypothetical protein
MDVIENLFCILVTKPMNLGILFEFLCEWLKTLIFTVIVIRGSRSASNELQLTDTASRSELSSYSSTDFTVQGRSTMFGAK